MRAPSFFLCFVAAVVAESVVATDYDDPVKLSARAWWNNAGWLETELWTVRDDVYPNNLANFYLIDSPYGTFKARGDKQLLGRLREIEAIHQLRNKDALESGGEGTLDFAKDKIGVAEDLIEDPETFVEDIPRGARALLRRAGSNLLKERRKGAYSSDNAVQSLLGADDRKRALAAKLQVDPYTDNQILQKELDRVATVKALPEFGVGFFIPGNSFFTVLDAGESARVADAYLSSPSDLFVKNRRAMLDDFGVSKNVAAEFLSREFVTPAQQSILVQSLATLSGATGRDLFIELSLNATTRHEFDFYRRNAELLAWYNQNRKRITAISSFKGLPLATDQSGARVFPFSVDLAGWCPDCGGILTDFADAGNGGVVLMSGRATDRTKRELASRGIELVFVPSFGNF
ncbi:MAG: hypothetical protein AAGC68_04695 [Verrucomicrobiota bacterium]